MRGRAGRWPIRSGSASTNACAPQSADAAHGGPALDAAGRAREDAQVAELTGLLRESAAVTASTAGRRICGLCAAGEDRGGAELSLFEQLNGFRDQITATATRGGQPQRSKRGIGCTPAWKGSSAAARTPAWPAGPRRRSRSTLPGSPRSPSRSTCCVWMRRLLLDGPLAKAEPTTLRYRLLHAAARLVRRSRDLSCGSLKLALGQGFRRRGQPRPGRS